MKFNLEKITAFIIGAGLTLLLINNFGCNNEGSVSELSSDTLKVDTFSKQTVTTLPIDSEMQVKAVFDSLKK